MNQFEKCPHLLGHPLVPVVDTLTLHMHVKVLDLDDGQLPRGHLVNDAEVGEEGDAPRAL